MVARVKVGDVGGGSWQVISDGTLRVKSGDVGGGSWSSPASLKVKSGNVGGGSWLNSGYVSEPNPPQNFAINAWTVPLGSNGTLSVKWTAPAAGGAPATSYEIELRNSANTSTIQSKVDSASPSVSFTGLAEDTKYYVRIRSRAASGLVSSWVYLKPWMGHAKITSNRWVRKVRSYAEAQYHTYYVGAPLVGPAPKSRRVENGVADIGVYVKEVTLSYTISQWTNSLTSSSRQAYLRNGDTGPLQQLLGTAQGGPFGGQASPAYQPVGVADRWSDGGVWCLYLSGGGWGTYASSYYALTAIVQVLGDEYYTQIEAYTSRTELANRYW